MTHFRWPLSCAQQRFQWRCAGSLNIGGLGQTRVGDNITPLIAVARHFGWDYDMIERAAAACNASNKVRFLSTVTPTLMLVPATRGRGDSEEITLNYLDVLHELRPKCLHITRYGFLQSRLPVLEVSWVLNRILDQLLPTSLQTITFDIDERRSQDFYRLMRPSLPEPDVDPWA